MQSQNETDNKNLFTELIKKQIVILGPDITLAKVRNVKGIEVDQNGEVTGLAGDPQVLLQELIGQFVELSGLIVKKTMESILSTHPQGNSGGLQVGINPALNVMSAMPSVSGISSIPVTPAEVPSLSPNVGQEPIIPAPNENIDDLNKIVTEFNSSVAQVQQMPGMQSGSVGGKA